MARPASKWRLTARQRALCEEWYRFAWHLTVKYFPGAREVGYRLTLDDAAAAALDGLVHAAKKFRRGRGVKFGTYAAYWIRQAIQREIDQSRLIHLPGGLAADVARQDRGKPILASARRVDAARDLMARQTCFAGANDWDQDFPAEAWAPEDGEADPALAAALAALPERERLALTWHFGLGGERLTLKEIGGRIGCTRERVRQLEREALDKLRTVLSART